MNISLTKLLLPEFKVQIKEHDGLTEILDIYRKKWVRLTPEEWVRQHILHYLTEELSYPKGLLKVEHSLRYGKLSKRADAVFFDRTGNPLMIVECKAPTVKIDNDVLMQALLYNKNLKAKAFLLTNGLLHLCAVVRQTSSTLEYLDTIPEYQRICENL